MTAKKSDTLECGQASEKAFPNTECGLCKASPGFLLYLQFGPGLLPGTRRKIERFVKQVLEFEETFISNDRSPQAGRKRRRDHENGQTGADTFENGNYGLESRKRQRRLHERNERGDTDTGGIERIEGISFADKHTNGSKNSELGLELVFYDKDAGFNIDKTADNVLDSEIRYERSTNMVVGMEREALLGNLCFNCSLPGHEIRDCPMPPDKERIEANRNTFNDKGSAQFNSRLYLCFEEEKHMEDMRRKYMPGQRLSQQLSEALGLEHENDIPEYIERMYHFGYPPAYLGISEGQDPLAARLESVSKPPPTPSLIVYNSAADYEKHCDRSIALDKPDKTEQKESSFTDSGDSDEEGAIPEDEHGNSPENEQLTEPSESSKPRNFPLVRYNGLDLSRFDFKTDIDPGKPLQSRRTPHRYSRAQRSPQIDIYNRSLVYDNRFRNSERNSRYADDYFYQDRGSRPAPRGFRAYEGGVFRDGYNDEYYRDGGDNWTGMLDSYYRSTDYQGSERQHSDNQGYYHYDYKYNDSRDSGYARYDDHRDLPKRYEEQYYNSNNNAYANANANSFYSEQGYDQTDGYNGNASISNEASLPSHPPAPMESQTMSAWPSNLPYVTTQQPATDHMARLPKDSAQAPLRREDLDPDQCRDDGSDVEDGECDMEESD